MIGKADGCKADLALESFCLPLRGLDLDARVHLVQDLCTLIPASTLPKFNSKIVVMVTALESDRWR